MHWAGTQSQLCKQILLWKFHFLCVFFQICMFVCSCSEWKKAFWCAAWKANQLRSFHWEDLHQERPAESSDSNSNVCGRQRWDTVSTSAGQAIVICAQCLAGIAGLWRIGQRRDPVHKPPVSTAKTNLHCCASHEGFYVWALLGGFQLRTGSWPARSRHKQGKSVVPEPKACRLMLWCI